MHKLSPVRLFFGSAGVRSDIFGKSPKISEKKERISPENALTFAAKGDIMPLAHSEGKLFAGNNEPDKVTGWNARSLVRLLFL